MELKPGGKDIPVTTANRIAYIHLVADYRLNKQIRPHCLAFRQGLANVVNLEWLRMFDQQEIQVQHVQIFQEFNQPATHCTEKSLNLFFSLKTHMVGADIGGPCSNFSGGPEKVHKLLW